MLGIINLDTWTMKHNTIIAKNLDNRPTGIRLRMDRASALSYRGVNF